MFPPIKLTVDVITKPSARCEIGSLHSLRNLLLCALTSKHDDIHALTDYAASLQLASNSDIPSASHKIALSHRRAYQRYKQYPTIRYLRNVYFVCDVPPALLHEWLHSTLPLDLRLTFYYPHFDMNVNVVEQRTEIRFWYLATIVSEQVQLLYTLHAIRWRKSVYNRAYSSCLVRNEKWFSAHRIDLQVTGTSVVCVEY